MARDAKVPDKYGDVVQRLEEVVKRLEGGELSLEDSLKDFEDGIRLVRRGESLLGEAERRIEQLLADGSKEPLAAAQKTEAVAEVELPAPRRNGGQAEDVPF